MEEVLQDKSKGDNGFKNLGGFNKPESSQKLNY